MGTSERRQLFLLDGFAVSEIVTDHHDSAVRIAWVLRISHRYGEGSNQLRIVLEVDRKVAEPFPVRGELDLWDKPGLALEYVPHRIFAASRRDLD